MPTFTPELAGTSLIVMLIGYVIALAFQVYMLYLNYKQAKVKDKTEIMIELLKEISKKLDKK